LGAGVTEHEPLAQVVGQETQRAPITGAAAMPMGAVPMAMAIGT